MSAQEQNALKKVDNEPEMSQDDTMEVETYEIDKSALVPDSDDDVDEDAENYDDETTRQEQWAGEGDDFPMYEDGEGESVDDFDVAELDDKHKGDSEAHDGEDYDASIVNMAKTTLKLHTDSVFSIALDEINNIIATGSGDDTATIIDTNDNSIIYRFDEEFDDSVIKVLFSPVYTIIPDLTDNNNNNNDTTNTNASSKSTKYLAIACMSGLVRMYDVESILEHKKLSQNDRLTTPLSFAHEFNPEFDLDTITWHPTQPIIAIATANGQTALFNLITEETKFFYGHNDSISAALFSQDGSSMITTSLDSQVIINNFGTSPFDPAPLQDNNKKKQVKHKQLHEVSPAICVVCHPNLKANIVCVGSGSGGLYTLSTADSVHGGVKSDNAHSDSIEKVAFYYVNPKTLYLFSSSIDGTLKAWNYTDSLQARFTIALPYAVTSFQFHPIAQLLIIASHDGIIRVHNAVDGKHIIDITGHQDAILDLIVTKDMIYTCSDDKTLRMFSLTELLPPDVLKPPQTLQQPVVTAHGAQQTAGAPNNTNATNKPGLNIVGGNFQRRAVVKPTKPNPAAKQ